MPGLDFKGNRHDMNRDQPGMQQLEVGIDYQFLNFFLRIYTLTILVVAMVN